MCHKLGKGHPNYVNRAEAARGLDGKLYRAHNGRPYGQTYGHNILVAFSDLEDKLQSGPFNQSKYKLTRAKQRRLKRLDNLFIYGQVHVKTYDSAWQVKHINHLVRNNISHVEHQ